MGLVQTIRNWISVWRGRGTPSATVDFWNSDQFMLKDVHGLSDELRLKIDELIKANKGLESGLLRKRWILPLEALDPLRKLFPEAKIAPSVTELNERTREQRARFALSSAKLLDELPYQLQNFGIEMYPFQHAAVAYLLRAKQCVLGDEAGVGKTFPAIAAACLVREVGQSVIVICPANLKLNWASEIKRARPDDTIFLCYGQKPSETPSGDWIILNYDIAVHWVETLRQVPATVVILDEVHNCKNPSAQRSAACLQIAAGKPYRFGLTGTLFRNRHAEAFYPLRVLGQLDALGGQARLLRDYCEGSESVSVDSEGFNKLLRQHCYVRREKRDVLTQLPAKMRAHLVVDIDNRKRYTTQESALIAWLRQVRPCGLSLRPNSIGRPIIPKTLNSNVNSRSKPCPSCRSLMSAICYAPHCRCQTFPKTMPSVSSSAILSIVLVPPVLMPMPSAPFMALTANLTLASY